LRFSIKTHWVVLLIIFVASSVLSGCVANGEKKPSAGMAVEESKSGTKGKSATKEGEKAKNVAYPSSERSCLERAIFFEANRSSREGLIAVGTVVMNRVNSSHYPNTICGVVGQKGQFAAGVLTRKINMEKLPDIREAADAVLRGERHPKLKNAMFFHVAGMKFSYNNMHYMLVAGGNAFYERRKRDGSLHNPVHDTPYDVAYAFAQEKNMKVEKETSQVFEAVVADASAAVETNIAEKSVVAAGEQKLDEVVTAAVVPVSRPQVLLPSTVSAVPSIARLIKENAATEVIEVPEDKIYLADSAPIPSSKTDPEVALALSRALGHGR